ncbi:MAG: RNA polymerase sigma factor [Methanocorpusculum sp.]|nr:RNA polymerase sigma factor [Oscillospiraceae bacterium]MBQ3569399.1 RNA polymerase sigma factor [Methanocorpusculum sp.]
MDNGASSYRRFLDGDDTGFVEIVRDYKDGLILFLNRYVNNIHTAEELMEETFFRLATRRPRFTAKYTFKTWLYTIGRNIALNYLKRAARIASTSMEDSADMSDEADLLERSYIQSEDKRMLYRALDNINPDYSAILYLIFFEDLTNAQAAKVMKRSNRQIANLLYRAKLALKSELEKEGFTYEGL